MESGADLPPPDLLDDLTGGGFSTTAVVCPPHARRHATDGGKKVAGRHSGHRQNAARHPTTPETIAPADTDVDQAIARLEKAVRFFQAHTGPIHPSPLFGAMDKQSALKLQLIHFGHHFRLLKPVSF